MRICPTQRQTIIGLNTIFLCSGFSTNAHANGLVNDSKASIESRTMYLIRTSIMKAPPIRRVPLSAKKRRARRLA